MAAVKVLVVSSVIFWNSCSPLAYISIHYRSIGRQVIKTHTKICFFERHFGSSLVCCDDETAKSEQQRIQRMDCLLMQPVSIKVQHHTSLWKYPELERAVQLKLGKSSCCLVKSSNSSLVICEFCKILRPTHVLFSDWVTRFSDVCLGFKLCKRVKVSKKSSFILLIIFGIVSSPYNFVLKKPELAKRLQFY